MTLACIGVRPESFRSKRFAANSAALAALAAVSLSAQPSAPRFELVQPELFGVTGGQPNAWADFDNDTDLDEFVGFRACRSMSRPAVRLAST